MSPDRERPGSVRSADVVNEEIRTLMVETGTWLWGPTRTRYEQLRDEWVAAVRAEIVEAA